MAYIIKRGDAGALPVVLKIGPKAETAQPVTEEALELLHCVEFTLGDTIRKMWPDEVVFADGRFLVPYTQEETIALEKGDYLFDVRVHFETNGVPEQVVGTKIRSKVKVVESNSEEVLP